MRSKLALQTLQVLILIAILLVSFGTATIAQEKIPYQIPKTEKKVNIDGSLDDPAWQEAFSLELKYETYPGENTEAPVRTQVYLMYDNAYVYVGFKAFDPQPENIRARYKDRDNIYGEDRVSVYFDTFNDELRSYRFASNALGVQSDSYSGGSSWDAIWDSAGEVYDWGYCVEMAIPFNVLRFQQTDGEQIWGFFAEREYPRSKSHTFRNTPRERGNNCSLCQADKIKGFANLSPGRNIEINPTFSAIRMDERANFPNGDLEELDTTSNLGVSGKWGVTSNYTLSGAINPDFSQISADSLYLTINERFTVRRSEKRPFFLEGNEYFDDVHTRMIVDPTWGVKFTGREGDNSFGILTARDEVTRLIFPGSQGSESTTILRESNASVLSYNRDIGNNSTIGAMYTDRESGDYYNRVVSANGNFRLTKNDSLYVKFIGSNTQYEESIAEEFGQRADSFSGSQYNISYSRDTRNWHSRFFYSHIGEDVRTDLDHKTMAGYKSMGASLGRTWYGEEDDLFTRATIDFDYDNMEDLNGNLLDRSMSFGAEISGPMQSEVDYRVSKSTDGYYGKTYDNWSHRISFDFKPTGDTMLDLSFRAGDAIDYTHNRQAFQLSMSPEVEIYVGKHIRLSVEYDFTSMTVEGERLYMTNTVESWLTYQVNSRIFIRSILQYADIRMNQEMYEEAITPETKELFTQLLFSYKINPRTVLYLGYSDNYYGAMSPEQALTYGLTQSDRTVFFKLGYAWVM